MCFVICKDLLVEASLSSGDLLVWLCLLNLPN